MGNHNLYALAGECFRSSGIRGFDDHAREFYNSVRYHDGYRG